MKGKLIPYNGWPTLSQAPATGSNIRKALTGHTAELVPGDPQTWQTSQDWFSRLPLNSSVHSLLNNVNQTLTILPAKAALPDHRIINDLC